MGYHGNKVPNPLTPSLPAAALRTMGVSSAHRLRYILEGEREEGVRGKGRGGGGVRRECTHVHVTRVNVGRRGGRVKD